MSNKDANIYKRCALFDKTTCGPYKDRRYEKVHGLVKVTELVKDTTGHFTSLKFKDYIQNLLWSERQLIENRAGKEFSDDSEICQHHRNVLGINWNQRQHCMHHLHPPHVRGQKSCATKLAPLWLVRKLNSEIPFSFTLGGKICNKHMNIELQRRKQNKEQQVPMEEEEELDNLDQSFRPDDFHVPEDVQDEASTRGQNLAEALSISPAPFQLTKTRIRDLGSSALRDIKRKYDQFHAVTDRCFAESVAPGQSDELLAALNNVSNSNEDEIAPDLAPFVPVYLNSDPKERVLVLSIVDHSSHTKKELMNVFGCTKYEVEGSENEIFV